MKALTNRGGKRKGSGQKLKYNEPTKTISFRCPISKIGKLKEIIKNELLEFTNKQKVIC